MKKSLAAALLLFLFLAACAAPYGGLIVDFDNKCPTGSTWHVKVINREKPSLNGYVDLKPGESKTGVFVPPGSYIWTEWTDDGSFTRGPFPLNVLNTGSNQHMTRKLCDPNDSQNATNTPTITRTPAVSPTPSETPAPTEKPTPAEPPKPTLDPAFTAPRQYYFGNNCVGEPFGRAKDGVYWNFTLLESFTGDTAAVGKTVEVFIPLGESRTGSLPAGRYHIKSWFGGADPQTKEYEDNISGSQGMIVVNFCPDLPLLPDAPKN